MSGKVQELLSQAKLLIHADNPLRPELWRAYVAVEYAILDLKLRHRLEGAPAPPKLTRKNAVDLALARSLLDRVDPTSDEKKLLYDLRGCRDVLKSLVASYERRSTTS